MIIIKEVTFYHKRSDKRVSKKNMSLGENTEKYLFSSDEKGKKNR